MKTRITEQPEIQSYPIGIYCYFGFDLILESCEVSVCQTQSVNKRYPICPNLPCCEQHIALRRRFGGKNTIIFTKEIPLQVKNKEVQASSYFQSNV